jgi:ribosomal-protein-alanine N-acetyltransferase
MLTAPLIGSRLHLRCLQDDDVTPRYVAWLNDPAVNRFLEVRFARQTIESTRDFVRAVNASRDTLLLGIFVDEGRRHVGNIKIGPVNTHHRRADIGLVVGEAGEWGKGYATEAIWMIAEHGFRAMGLQKITAGCYGDNTGSLRAFEKAGFVLEARLPQHWQAADGVQDGLLLGMTRAQFDAAAART